MIHLGILWAIPGPVKLDSKMDDLYKSSNFIIINSVIKHPNLDDLFPIRTEEQIKSFEVQYIAHSMLTIYCEYALRDC